MAVINNPHICVFTSRSSILSIDWWPNSRPTFENTFSRCGTKATDIWKLCGHTVVTVDGFWIFAMNTTSSPCHSNCDIHSEDLGSNMMLWVFMCSCLFCIFLPLLRTWRCVILIWVLRNGFHRVASRSQTFLTLCSEAPRTVGCIWTRHSRRTCFSLRNQVQGRFRLCHHSCFSVSLLHPVRNRFWAAGRPEILSEAC